MTNYSTQPKTEKHAKASGSEIPCHFKNTYEAAKMMKGKTIEQIRRYFGQVLEHKQCVPFMRFNGGIGRTGQATQFGWTQGRWPEKSVKYLLTLIDNLENNAKAKQLNLEEMVITHVQLNQAQKGRRRTYRAHGRITPYFSHPFHIELIAEEKAKQVAKPEQKTGVVSVKKIAKNKRVRLAVGGDQ